MKIIIIFRSRSQTLKCVNFLRSAGFNATVTDTPLNLYGSCTISVRCDQAGFMYFRQSARAFPAYIGAYAAVDGKYTRIF